MLTGISTLSIGDVNAISQQYLPPPGFAWADLYKDIPQNLLISSSIYPPPPVDSWYWSIMNMVLFLVLAWYISRFLLILGILILSSLMNSEFARNPCSFSK